MTVKELNDLPRVWHKEDKPPRHRLQETKRTREWSTDTFYSIEKTITIFFKLNFFLPPSSPRYGKVNLWTVSRNQEILLISFDFFFRVAKRDEGNGFVGKHMTTNHLRLFVFSKLLWGEPTHPNFLAGILTKRFVKTPDRFIGSDCGWFLLHVTKRKSSVQSEKKSSMLIDFRRWRRRIFKLFDQKIETRGRKKKRLKIC